MRSIVNCALLALLATPATAQRLGTTAPSKSSVPARQTLTRDRQGGDTLADAFQIPALPFADTGTTVGYTDDYDEICPYHDSVAPDVVYAFQVVAATLVTIDMCGSGYDTKIYLYRDDFTLVACNDDFYNDDECGVYTSRIEFQPVEPAVVYYLVIDGYGEQAGDYQLLVEEVPPCDIVCPPGGFAEGEPPIGGFDEYNGGCYFPIVRFQGLVAGPDGDLTLCGRSGWYGDIYRDSDWFILQMGPTDAIELVADADYATYFFELWPQDCETVDVLQQATAGRCAETTMTITGYDPGEVVWLWVGPTVFFPPEGTDDEYDYVVNFTGLEGPIATQASTWGDLKSLYR